MLRASRAELPLEVVIPSCSSRIANSIGPAVASEGAKAAPVLEASAA
ncbi:MAG TPA: hypothetical protein VH063_15975 [Gaiellaceae bacterium]|jgi:hypothetical protein|nr:hypothetical protein [Gaiellaceae bacterium]